ncbi:MAG TPA: HisA/HisF-related TIM barrel protein [Ramlibacter sp.]|uniref:HisA/HisF-related TIM barrel protein n=1 Tax=Ramlibacter sp. TaxID=1917967 RepID=UPI002D7E1DAD|nr:HisA/HisF-related TIM barrel protein [Ramlibacter sp.]HET8747318.1 HisA/HisF-related TIM barrel protein [Ramlibacter sp.]
MPSPDLQVIPVLDLMGGQVVRGVRGERHAYRPIVSRLADGSAPRAVARGLRRAAPPPPGARPVLYVADLDAIQGGAVQLDALADLLQAQPDLCLWVDAGFAGPGDVRVLRAALGPVAARIRPVYGSESLAGAAALEELARDPDAILSLDSRLERPLDPAGAWQRPEAWPGTVIVMTLDRVGAGTGPDLVTFARLRALAPDRTWIGAGGVRDAADLCAAAASGAAAWLVASALHDGSLQLS